MIKNSTHFKVSLLIFVFLINSAVGLAQLTRKNTLDGSPEPTGWVNDFEDIFTKEQETRLDSILAAYERRTTIEIVVLTIPEHFTPEEHFNEYVLQTARKWGVGKNNKHNGIVIGFSKGLRKIRILNGYGIEMIITGKQTDEVMNRSFISNFKRDDYFKGTLDGILAYIDFLDRKAAGTKLNLNNISVFEFIQMLRIESDADNAANIVTVDVAASAYWLDREIVNSLLPMMFSDEPAKCVVLAESSQLPLAESATIGGHVLSILEAYKNNHVYPAELKKCPRSDYNKRDGFKVWWETKSEKQ